MQGVLRLNLLAMQVALVGGCSFLLPSAKQDVDNPWQNFEDAKRSFDAIVPYQTGMDTVRKLGFDPLKTPNMQLLNQSQVVSAVLPSPAQVHDPLPQGIVDCIRAHEGCVGYLMQSSRISRKRIGNFPLDFLNFRRTTLTTGWKFEALIVVVDTMVVFKQWSGQPKIETTELQANPLGPLQGMGETIKPGP